MIEVPLSRGQMALIDEDDLPLIQAHTWWFYAVRAPDAAGYAFTTINRRCVFMHRLIMSARSGQTIDHVNRNGLDNRRKNLRFCTPAQNSANRIAGASSSGFRGVHKRGRPGKLYQVRLVANHKKYIGGTFDCPIEAAKAYDVLAFKHLGEFAGLNFPSDYSLRGIAAEHTSTLHEQEAAHPSPAVEDAQC